VKTVILFKTSPKYHLPTRYLVKDGQDENECCIILTALVLYQKCKAYR